ncbi:hypothetical protein [Massilia sp. DWR3-1-1]|uniref:hypothetical protein n=1 Tax=Massilia sp. DWR3-1-1 TaxID=2804559 RepID=UPI003CF96C66
MRIRTQLALALATATVTLGASAAPSSTVEAGNAMVAVQTIAASAPRLPGAAAAGFAGNYDLNNGDTMRVSYEHRRLFAEMGQRKAELVPIDANRFALRGTDVQLRFDQLPFATDVVVSGR